MNPYNKHDLQTPAYTPDGYVVTNSNGDSICLHSDGDYTGMEFAEIDFSFLTIRADFSKASFKHCLFNLTDMSESTFSEASFHDCLMTSVAFMWTKSSKLKMTKTSVSDVRFFSSELQQAHIEADFEEANFNHVNLSKAHFIKSKLSNCEFTDSNCTDLTISRTSLDVVKFKTCDMRWLRIEESTADFLKIFNSNLSGSTWLSVASSLGYWGIHSADLTAARFSMCHASNSTWSNSTFFGTVMERCNWYKSDLDMCVILSSHFQSVGWNETTFKDTHIYNLYASALRLRFAKFSSCEIVDTTISDSYWEFCDFRFVFPTNLSIVNPAYSDDTKWHAGFTPINDPNPTPKDSADDGDIDEDEEDGDDGGEMNEIKEFNGNEEEETK